MGGLKINADAEVLDTQGNVIPGLYAAGETTGGTQSAGPYELRLPIFLQPLGGALKNRSAVPASPPCFRRRRTGCGTQHPLRLACVSLAAAPTTPRCFRRWRRSSSLQSASLLFESTHLCESDICAEENRQCISTPAVFSWARVDYASRESKKPRRGLFAAGTYSGGPYELRLPIFLRPLGGALKNRSAAPASPPCFRRRRRSAPLLFESTLESETSVFYKTKSPAYFHTLSIFGGRGWIRTTEAEKQQIYSLSPLATREHAHILFVSVAGRLAYFIIGFWICQPLFSFLFLFEK